MKSSYLTYICDVCLLLGIVLSHFEVVTGQFTETQWTANNTGEFTETQWTANNTEQFLEELPEEIIYPDNDYSDSNNSYNLTESDEPISPIKFRANNDSLQADLSCYECTTGNYFLQEFCIDPFYYASENVNISEPCPRGTYGCLKGIVFNYDEIYYFRECIMIDAETRKQKLTRLNYSIYFFGICYSSLCNAARAAPGPGPLLLLGAVALSAGAALCTAQR